MGKKNQKVVSPEPQSDDSEEQQSYGSQDQSSDQDDDIVQESQESEQSDQSDHSDSAEDVLIQSIKQEQMKSKHQDLQQNSLIDSDILKKIIERDSHEMNTILDEYQKSMDQVQNKLKPVLEKVNNSTLALGSGGIPEIETKNGMSYLEMKYNLMLSYCSFLSYYLLLKLEGKSVHNHPVVMKLVHIKTIFEKLRHLDSKLQYQVDKLMKQAALAETQGEDKILGKRPSGKQDDLKYKPNADLLAQNDEEDSDEDGEEGDEKAEANSEYDDEEDSDISDDLQKQKKKAKSTSKKQSKDEKEEKQIYKASKLNPIMYQSQVDKSTKNIQRQESHQKHKLNKSNYIQMLREEVDDRPEEVVGANGLQKKTQYMKDMETLEKVETMNFTRMQMTKAQKKYHRQQMMNQNIDKLDQIDEFKDIENILYNKAERQIDAENMNASAQLGSNSFKKSMKSYLKDKGTGAHNGPNKGLKGNDNKGQKRQRTK